MYCYKCGDHNSDRRAVCRTCHFPLLPFDSEPIEMVSPAFSDISLTAIVNKAEGENTERSERRLLATIIASIKRANAPRRAIREEVKRFKKLVSDGKLELTFEAIASASKDLPRISDGVRLLLAIDGKRLSDIQSQIAPLETKLSELLKERTSVLADLRAAKAFRDEDKLASLAELQSQMASIDKADKESLSEINAKVLNLRTEIQEERKAGINKHLAALRRVDTLIRGVRKNIGFLQVQSKNLSGFSAAFAKLKPLDQTKVSGLASLALKIYRFASEEPERIISTRRDLASTRVISVYRSKVGEAKAYRPTIEEASDYRQECLNAIEKEHTKQTDFIQDFYRPKLKEASGRREKTEVEENLNGALADENEKYSLSKFALGDDNQALCALHDTRVVVAQANVPMPERDDTEGSHALIQYLHKRTEKTRNVRESSACFLVVGIILLIIGFLFYFLSYKVPKDPTIINKILVPTSFEFIVCVVGLSVGSVFFVYGLTRVIMSAVEIYRNKRAVNYLSHYQNLKE